MWTRIVEWIREDITWPDVGLGIGIFVATFIISLLLVGFLLVRLPPTYFQEKHPRDFWGTRPSFLRVLIRIGKNLLGLLVLAAGVVMLVGPGQGILTILIGIMLVDFPGKRKLERLLVGRPKVLRAINRLRRKYGRPPLILDRRGEQQAIEHAEQLTMIQQAGSQEEKE